MTLATIAAASGEEIVPFELPRAQKSLFQALTDARATYGGSPTAVVDGDERALSYDEGVRGSLAVGGALRDLARRGEAVALVLPSGRRSVVAFSGVAAY